MLEQALMKSVSRLEISAGRRLIAPSTQYLVPRLERGTDQRARDLANPAKAAGYR